MTELENQRAQHDIGVFAIRIYRGARDEGATRYEAFVVLLAWFRATLMQNEADE